MTKRQLMDEITNFIEYYTSEEVERQQMGDALIDYMLDVYEEPKEVMTFTFDVRNGQDIFWKKAVGDNSPEREFFPIDELHLWVNKYRNLGWEVKVN